MCVDGRNSAGLNSVRHIVFGLFSNISSMKKEVGLEDEVSENELKFILNFSSGI
jgi:hypothetical protein